MRSPMTIGDDGAERKPELLALTSTIDLLERYKQGGDQAVSLLVERSIPPLKRWARGRLPQWARGLARPRISSRTPSFAPCRV